MKHVRQPDDSPTCGHACLAMILEISYADACVLVGWRDKGIGNETMMRLINASGSVICGMTQRSTWDHMRTPTSDLDFALVSMRVSRSDGEYGHWVVLRDEIWYDPNFDDPFPVKAGLPTFLDEEKDIWAVQLWDVRGQMRKLGRRCHCGCMKELERSRFAAGLGWLEKREET